MLTKNVALSNFCILPQYFEDTKMKEENTHIIHDTSRFVVTQSNELVEANYSSELTAHSHKIARLIVSLISPDDKDLRTYTVSIDAVKRYLGMPLNTRWGSFYKRLKETATRLNSNPIEIKKPNGDYLVSYFISSFEVSPKQGTITFEISGLLKPYLLGLKKNYTSYQLAYIPNLKSSYSIRLYELLHQYRRIGKRYFELSDLQKKVGSSYDDKYNNFKRRVLLQAQKDLKQHTDLAFAFDERKEGRKVCGIQFIIFGNTPKKEKPFQLSFLEDAIEVNDKVEKPALSSTIIKALNKLGISEQNIAKYLAQEFEIIADEKQRNAAKNRCKTIENYYLEKLELTKTSASRGNAAGFLIKALQEDWATSKTKQEFQTKEAIKKYKAIQSKIKALKTKIEKLSVEKEAAKNPVFKRLVADETILKEAYDVVMEGLGDFMRNHVSSVKHLPIKEQYEQQVTIQQSINFQLTQKFPEKFSKAQSIDDVIQAAQKEIETLKKENKKV